MLSRRPGFAALVAKFLRRGAHDPQGVDKQLGASIRRRRTFRDEPAPRAHAWQAGVQALHVTDHRAQTMPFRQSILHVRDVALDDFFARRQRPLLIHDGPM
jgi:hypothetical protein